MFERVLFRMVFFTSLWLFQPILPKEISNVLANHQVSLHFCMDWSPDGRYLATGSDDGKIRIWEVGPSDFTSKKPICEKVQGSIVESLKWSGSGKFLASGADASGTTDSELIIWHFDASRKLKKVSSLSHDFSAKTVKSLAWSAHDRYLSAGFLSGQKKLLKVWQISKSGKLSERCEHEIEHGKSIFSIDWCNSSKLMAVGALARRGQFGIWRMDKKKVQKLDEADFAAFEVSQVCCSSHNVLAASSAAKISFWQLSKKTGRLTKYSGYDELSDGQDFDNTQLSWAKDGRLLAMGKANPQGELTILECDIANNKIAVHMELSINCPIGPITWSPVQNVLAVSGGDGKLRLFSLEKNKLHLTSIV